MKPEQTDPKSTQLPFYLKDGIGEQIHQLRHAFLAVRLGLKPVFAPHQVNGHDDAYLRVDEHHDLSQEAEFGVGARVVKEKGGVEESGNEVNRQPDEVIFVVELKESEEEEDQRDPALQPGSHVGESRNTIY